jgi:hypothetical protein
VICPHGWTLFHLLALLTITQNQPECEGACGQSRE